MLKLSELSLGGGVKFDATPWPSLEFIQKTWPTYDAGYEMQGVPRAPVLDAAANIMIGRRWGNPNAEAISGCRPVEKPKDMLIMSTSQGSLAAYLIA
jgi:hypothetical protein